MTDKALYTGSDILDSSHQNVAEISARYCKRDPGLIEAVQTVSCAYLSLSSERHNRVRASCPTNHLSSSILPSFAININLSTFGEIFCICNCEILL